MAPNRGRIRTYQYVSIASVRSPDIDGAWKFLHIAHQCAVMYDPAVEADKSMKTFSFTEFRKRASEILTLVEKGETVSVIRHGKTVAKIVPAESEENTPSWKRPGLRLVRPRASLSKAILAERRKSR